MKFTKKNTIKFLSLITLITLFSFESINEIKGWILAGSEPSKYEIGVEIDSNTSEKVGYLKSTATKIKKRAFGTLMQSFNPTDYLGKRVKLTASIKSENVKDWAGLWMRVDGKDREVLSFDNMQDRPIKRTTDWKEYEIILDVPEKTINLSYGVLLSGTGNIWIDNIDFEIVGSSTTITNSYKSKRNKKPINTDFNN